MTRTLEEARQAVQSATAWRPAPQWATEMLQKQAQVQMSSATRTLEEAHRLVGASSAWRLAPAWAVEMAEAPAGARTQDLVEAFVEVGVGEGDAVRLAERFAGGSFESFADAVEHRSAWRRESSIDRVKVAEVADRLGEVSPARTRGRLERLLQEKYPAAGPGCWSVNVMSVDEVRQVVRAQLELAPNAGINVYEQQYQVTGAGAVSLLGSPRRIGA